MSLICVLVVVSWTCDFYLRGVWFMVVFVLQVLSFLLLDSVDTAELISWLLESHSFLAHAVLRLFHRTLTSFEFDMDWNLFAINYYSFRAIYVILISYDRATATSFPIVCCRLSSHQPRRTDN